MLTQDTSGLASVRWPWVVAAALALAACGGGGSGGGNGSSNNPPPTTAASLEVTPNAIDDFWGYAVQTQVTARDSASAVISPRPAITFSAANTSIAGVDVTTTTVNLLRPGSTTVTATAGSVSASATVNVRGFERLARVGQDTMCALADGRQRIYCWGEAGVNGATMITSVPQQFDYVAPTPIPQGETPAGTRISKLAGDLFQLCALTDDGAVFCWGSAGTGALGIGADGTRTEPTRVVAGVVPSAVRFVDLAVTAYGSCAAGDDGLLYCWGRFDHIPNPLLAINGRFLSPVATAKGDVALDVKLVRVALDTDVGCALGDNGRAYCWNSASRAPKLIAQGAVPTNVKLVDIQMVSGMKCALADNGQVYCWGTGFAYLFGAGLTGFVSNAAPMAVLDGAKPAGVRFTAMTVGGSATASCAVAEDGHAYCWGKGYQGSLGDGDTADHEAYTPVRVLAGEKDTTFNWTQINCAQFTCTALASDRRIYSWGFNQNRMLSRDTQTLRSAVPLMVTPPTRP